MLRTAAFAILVLSPALGLAQESHNATAAQPSSITASVTAKLDAVLAAHRQQVAQRALAMLEAQAQHIQATLEPAVETCLARQALAPSAAPMPTPTNACADANAIPPC